MLSPLDSKTKGKAQQSKAEELENPLTLVGATNIFMEPTGGLGPKVNHGPMVRSHQINFYQPPAPFSPAMPELLRQRPLFCVPSAKT